MRRYIVVRMGIMISMVTHTPSKHLVCVFYCQSSMFSGVREVSIEKIHVLKMLSIMIRKMQIEVVIGDRARVSA